MVAKLFLKLMCMATPNVYLVNIIVKLTLNEIQVLFDRRASVFQPNKSFWDEQIVASNLRLLRNVLQEERKVPDENMDESFPSSR